MEEGLGRIKRGSRGTHRETCTKSQEVVGVWPRVSREEGSRRIAVHQEGELTGLGGANVGT